MFSRPFGAGQDLLPTRSVPTAKAGGIRAARTVKVAARLAYAGGEAQNAY